jgi:hypothetical protein
VAREGYEAEIAAKGEELAALQDAVGSLREWQGKFFAAVASDLAAMRSAQQADGREGSPCGSGGGGGVVPAPGRSPSRTEAVLLAGFL